MSNLFLDGKKKDSFTMITPGGNSLSEAKCPNKLEIEFVDDFGGMNKYKIEYSK